jgi:hypothetical protein
MGLRVLIFGLWSWMSALPIIARDRAESSQDRALRLEVVADAIARSSHGNRCLAAAIAVYGARESLYGLDWGSCHCQGEECDNGQAHGYWQWHRLPLEPIDDWDALCVVSEGVYPAAARAARWLSGCVCGDVECLGRRFARLGGLRDSVPVPGWAHQRAVDSVELSEKLRKISRKRRKGESRIGSQAR